jgi:oxygen-dependent protoporphyrinogen oxidase
MIPTNLDALANSTLISPAGKTRLAQEPELPPAPLNGDESVASFVTRRLGREVYEQLVEPLMSGIYAGDGQQLSLAATFPQLRQLELKHGSLLKGLQAGERGDRETRRQGDKETGGEGRGARSEDSQHVTRNTQAPIQAYPPFVSVTENRGRGYQVTLDDERTLTGDALIIATPAFATARLLAELDPTLASLHAQIPHASAAIITLAFAEADLPRPLDGYGYVIPQVEDTDVLACTWTSSKWVGRAPAGSALIRVYAGRYGRRDVTKLSNDELMALAYAEVQRVLGVTTPAQLERIHRWPQAMPQYILGHLERLAQIEERRMQHLALFLAGAAYRGVGIPDCIESGEQAARAAVKALTARSS